MLRRKTVFGKCRTLAGECRFACFTLEFRRLDAVRESGVVAQLAERRRAVRNIMGSIPGRSNIFISPHPSVGRITLRVDRSYVQSGAVAQLAEHWWSMQTPWVRFSGEETFSSYLQIRR